MRAWLYTLTLTCFILVLACKVSVGTKATVEARSETEAISEPAPCRGALVVHEGSTSSRGLTCPEGTLMRKTEVVPAAGNAQHATVVIICACPDSDAGALLSPPSPSL